MADNSDLMAEFQEFLSAKEKKAKEDSEAEDFEVEIWDADGRGVRTRRSHARPFLQSLGIDMETEQDDSGSDNTDKDAGKDNKGKPRQAKSTSAQGQSITRKYFTKPSK